MTFKDLLKALQSMNSERLEDTATVHVADMDEFYPVQSVATTSDASDVLDPGHYYLAV